MTEKIGVFICDCGNNISDTVDTKAVSEFASKQEGVTEIRIHRLWCSEEGREEMRKAIQEKGVQRVVVAACSPKQHEKTFQKVLASAGLNPYLLTMVNIREQIAWVTKDKAEGTEKAKAQLNAAIKRVKVQKPLEKSEIECKNDFVVIGAGIAGIQSALALAQKGRKVYLVEKEGWIGGKVVAYEDVFPNLECAPCMMEPKMDEVLHHERLVLLTNSEIENVKGFFGNFNVQIKKNARFVEIDKCIGCGACYDVCPVKVKNKFNGNMSERHAIYSAFAGVLPNAPKIDKEQCLRFKGENCTKCQESCAFGAINYEEKDETLNVDAGAIVVATGFDMLDVSGMKQFSPEHQNVYDAYQFERIISSTGPTDGKVLTKEGSPPKSIAFIHCAGSRNKNYKEYCSGVCCAYTMKLAHLAKKKLGDPNLKMYEIFSDWCLGGKGYQEFGFKMKGDSEQIRVPDTNEVKVTPNGAGLKIACGGKTIDADMVVLASAIVPKAGNEKLNALLGLTADKNGFLSADNEKISPASTTSRGIYIAGCCTGPKDCPESVMQGQAAAGMALNVLVPGEKLELEVATAEVNDKLCGQCRVCISLCPYQAISFNEEKKAAEVNQILCHGCGVCVSSCPSGAISNKHFSNEQINSEIEGVLL